MPLYPQLSYTEPDDVVLTSDISQYDGGSISIDSSSTTIDSSDGLNSVINKIIQDGINDVNNKVNNLATSDFSFDGSSGDYLVSGNGLNSNLQSLDGQIKSNFDSINGINGSNINFTGTSGTYITSGDSINKAIEDLDSNIGSGAASSQDIYDNTEYLTRDHVASGIALSGSSGLDVTYNSGSYYVNGKRIDINSKTKSLSSSSDNYTYLKDDGTIQIKSVSIGASTPSTDSDAATLYKHETNSSNVASSTDRRKLYSINQDYIADDSVLLRHISPAVNSRILPASPVLQNYVRYDGNNWQNVTPNQILSDINLTNVNNKSQLPLDGTDSMNANLNMGSNNITNVVNVDGRDVSTDGNKLDGIESGATADQTGSEIRDSIEGLAGSDKLDSTYLLTNHVEVSSSESTYPVSTLPGNYWISCDVSGGSLIVQFQAPGTYRSNSVITVSDVSDNAGTNNITVTDNNDITIGVLNQNGQRKHFIDDGTSIKQI